MLRTVRHGTKKACQINQSCKRHDNCSLGPSHSALSLAHFSNTSSVGTGFTHYSLEEKKRNETEKV
jgi:hypothetical protein